MPAMNICPIEVPDRTPNTIIVMLGGISGSMTALIATKRRAVGGRNALACHRGDHEAADGGGLRDGAPGNSGEQMLASTVTSDNPPLK